MTTQLDPLAHMVELEDTNQLTLFSPEELQTFAASVPAEFSILEAPLGLIPETKLPKTFNKANSAISVQAIEGNYTLVMRLLLNVLLALSSAILKKMPEGTLENSIKNDQVLRFEASATDIKNMLGWGRSNDYQSVYNALDGLMRLVVRWNIRLKQGGEEWTRSTPMLSQWDRADSGKIAWFWMPSLSGLLFELSGNYTPLDLVLLRKFRSKYTLAIYENCMRFRNNGCTPVYSTSNAVLIIAGPDKYQDYREFKRTVLKPSIEELNKTPGARITVQLEEIRAKRYNRVEGIQFKIFLNNQNALWADLPAGFNQSLLNSLKELGVADSMIGELANSHEHAFLMERVQFVRAELTRNSNIQNPAGFFVASVKERVAREYRTAEALLTVQLTELKATAPRVPKSPESEALLAFEALEQEAPAEYARLLKQFSDGALFAVQQGLKNKGPKSKAVRVELGRWLVAQAMLPAKA